jgi:hypothetical protein
MSADSYTLPPPVDCDYSVAAGPSGKQLLLKSTAKLEKGCTVAVLQGRSLLLHGKLLRRPVPFRKLVIGYFDVNGTYGITRWFGLQDDDVSVWRVVGVMTPIDHECEGEVAP